MELLFWISAFGIAYSYVLYPITLLIFPKRNIFLPSANSSTDLPKVSIIITAYNEAARIEKKLDNTLSATYSKRLTEIIVASDGSSDTTAEIVGRYAERGVRIVCSHERKGKEHAQLLAIMASTGEILVFTDVGTTIPPESISLLIDGFRNPKVGAISSEDRLLSREGSIAAEGVYVRYEMWLRKLESSVNSLVGLSGSFFAVRRKICDLWDIHSPSDFTTAVNCVRTGYVAVSDPAVLGYYHDIKDEKKEYYRKVRTIIRGISGLFRHLDVLNPYHFRVFSFQLWSHKVMRWLVPWFLIGLLLSSVIAAPRSALYFAAATTQICFYLIALAALWSRRLRSYALFKVPFFFTQVNAAIAHATIAFLLGRRVLAWEPSRR